MSREPPLAGDRWTAQTRLRLPQEPVRRDSHLVGIKLPDSTVHHDPQDVTFDGDGMGGYRYHVNAFGQDGGIPQLLQGGILPASQRKPATLIRSQPSDL